MPADASKVVIRCIFSSSQIGAACQLALPYLFLPCLVLQLLQIGLDENNNMGLWDITDDVMLPFNLDGLVFDRTSPPWFLLGLWYGFKQVGLHQRLLALYSGFQQLLLWCCIVVNYQQRLVWPINCGWAARVGSSFHGSTSCICGLSVRTRFYYKHLFFFPKR
jgi:hypothetical protein